MVQARCTQPVYQAPKPINLSARKNGFQGLLDPVQSTLCRVPGGGSGRHSRTGIDCAGIFVILRDVCRHGQISLSCCANAGNLLR